MEIGSITRPARTPKGTGVKGGRLVVAHAEADLGSPDGFVHDGVLRLYAGASDIAQDTRDVARILGFASSSHLSTTAQRVIVARGDRVGGRSAQWPSFAWEQRPHQIRT